MEINLTGQVIKYITDTIKVAGDKIVHKHYNVPHKVILGRKNNGKRKSEVEKVDEIIEYLAAPSFYSDGYYSALDMEDEEVVNKIVGDAYRIYNKRKEENKKRSSRRSRQTVIDLAFCNPSLDMFLTLTFENEKSNDYSFAVSQVKQFCKRYKRKLGKNLNFIAVYEKQKNGRYHVHMICDFDYRLAFQISDIKFDTGNKWYDSVKKCFKRVKTNERKELEVNIQKEFWKNGFVDITKIEGNGTPFYITKYMCKETDNAIQNGEQKTRYSCSRGLNRPSVSSFYKDDSIEFLESQLEPQLRDLQEMEKSDNFILKTFEYEDKTFLSRTKRYLKNKRFSKIDGKISEFFTCVFDNFTHSTICEKIYIRKNKYYANVSNA